MATEAAKRTLNQTLLTTLLTKIKSWMLTVMPDEIKSRIPTALQNPNALTITTGTATDTYDGSAAKTVTIPAVTVDGNTIAFGDVKIGVD